MSKYEVWSGRWAERLKRYNDFEAADDPAALKKFEEYENDSALKFSKLVLYPVVVAEGKEVRGKPLKKVREFSGDDDALDFVA
jgi:hypothetical protein